MQPEISLSLKQKVLSVVLVKCRTTDINVSTNNDNNKELQKKKRVKKSKCKCLGCPRSSKDFSHMKQKLGVMALKYVCVKNNFKMLTKG